MSETKADSKPTTIVIFGASGDLTRRKLVPALYNNFRKGRLPENTRIVGVARRDWSDDGFRQRLQEALAEFGDGTFEADNWSHFAGTVRYFQGDLSEPDDYENLDAFLRELEGEAVHRLYYLATAPGFFGPACRHLGAAGMASQEEGRRNIVIEKPFGHDLESALALDREIHATFDENQVYPIDHYLGKETAQNILIFRFANTIFEPVWNQRYVDNVQITVAESVEVGRRAGYYDHAGVLRDMFQNHLLQTAGLDRHGTAGFVRGRCRLQREGQAAELDPPGQAIRHGPGPV